MDLVNTWIVIYWTSIAAVMLIGAVQKKRAERVAAERGFYEGYCNAMKRLREEPLLRIEVLGGAAVGLAERSAADGTDEAAECPQGSVDDDCG